MVDGNVGGGGDLVASAAEQHSNGANDNNVERVCTVVVNRLDENQINEIIAGNTFFLTHYTNMIDSLHLFFRLCVDYILHFHTPMSFNRVIVAFHFVL